MKLILVRHGESIGNSENRLQGQEDYDLTELGLCQAALTGERLAAEGTSQIYTSPLLRALATAKVAAERLGVEPKIVPAVSEYHFGELSGSTYREVRERFGASVTATERVYPGEEGRETFFQRVTEGIWEIVERHRGETVAVVSHGGPIALFCQMVLGLAYKRPMPFSIDNCSLNLIDVSEDATEERRPRAILVRLNDRCHLNELRE